MKQQIIKRLINLKVIFILLMVMIISSCGLSIPGTKIHAQEMQAFYDMTSSIKPSNSQGQDPYDVNDLKGCMFLAELSKWKEEEYRWGKSWERKNKWRKKGWVSYNWSSVMDYSESKQLHKEVANSNDKYIYIGPWRYSKILGKKIRFFATQEKDDITIGQGFESINDYNKNIKQKAFSLDKNFVLPIRDDVCEVKWIAKFGHNAQAEYILSKTFIDKLLYYLSLTGREFPKIYTGRIVDVESGEIIYNGNIFTGENSKIEHPVRLLKYNGKFNGDGLWNK